MYIFSKPSPTSYSLSNTDKEVIDNAFNRYGWEGNEQNQLNSQIKDLATYLNKYENGSKDSFTMNNFIDEVTTLCKKYSEVSELFNQDKDFNYLLTNLLKVDTLFNNNKYVADRFVATIYEVIKSHVGRITHSNTGNQISRKYIHSTLIFYKGKVSKEFFQDLLILSVDNLLFQKSDNPEFSKYYNYTTYVLEEILLTEDILDNNLHNILQIINNSMNKKISNINNLFREQLLQIINVLNFFKQSKSVIADNANSLACKVLDRLVYLKDIWGIKYMIENYLTAAPGNKEIYKKAVNHLFNKYTDLNGEMTINQEQSLRTILTKYRRDIGDINIIEKIRQIRSINVLHIINEYFELDSIRETNDYQSSYKVAVNQIFTHIDNLNNENTLTYILRHHNVVSDENIRLVYRTTGSIDIINLIRGYTLDYRRDLYQSLPVRQDMVGGDNNNIQAAGQGGVATEVHRFTTGIEPVALQTLEYILEDIKKPSRSFTTTDLKKKFALLNNNKKQDGAQDALKKISEDKGDYSQKLETALPVIARVLNADNILWPPDYSSADNRWEMWLEQSFVEAATAYATGTDQTSCVKGIYERLFTGFRNLHPAIDMLYSYANIRKVYEDPTYILRNNKDQIVKLLISQSVGSKANNFDEKVKDTCRNLLLNSFEDAKNPTAKDEEEDEGFSVSLPQTYSHIKQYLDSQENHLDIIVRKKIEETLSAFNCIKLTPHIIECIVSTMNTIPTETTFPQDIDIVIVNNQLYHKKNGNPKKISVLTLSDLKNKPTIENVKQYIKTQKSTLSLINQKLHIQCDITLDEYIKGKLNDHFKQLNSNLTTEQEV